MSEFISVYCSRGFEVVMAGTTGQQGQQIAGIAWQQGQHGGRDSMAARTGAESKP